MAVNNTLRARARAAVGIAHLRLVKSVVVEVDKVDHNGNLIYMGLRGLVWVNPELDQV